MTSDEAKSRIDELVRIIDLNDRLYYVEARPQMADADYDRLYEELVKLEKEYPQLRSPNSPTLRVSGEPLTSFSQVRHSPPMKSLDKCYEKSDLRQFDLFLKKEIGPSIAWHYVVEPKVDGVSMSLYYENRELVRAATRGNGEVGDDVTANVRTIRSIPKILPGDAPDRLEVRGEVYMTRDGFVKLNEALDSEGRPTFMNPRNACAGSLKQLDPKVVAGRPLDMVVYNSGGVGCEDFKTHFEMVEAFRAWGFPVSPWSRRCDSIESAIAAVDELGGKRHDFRFEIDGAVMKIDERDLYASLGATAHSPRWARAYKYAPERAETIVESITVQVGRTGVLTPVAELKSVELSGSIISRATLHNADQIAEQDIRIGDHVWLVKAGDVIPAIDGVIKEKRPSDAVPFEFPQKCPVCGTDVVRLEGEVAIRCVNIACPAQLKRRLEHFCSRNALDIKALGGKVADVLVDKGIVKDVLDLFSLDYDELATRNIGDFNSPRKLGKNAWNIREAVESARNLPLERWLFAIGIPQVGATVAKDFARLHENLSSMKGSEELKKVGTKAAEAVLEFFDSNEGERFLNRMAELGIDPKRSDDMMSAGTGPLSGKTFVLTGTLSKPRPEYARQIEAAGGTVQSSVTSKTMYLVAGENVGATKTEKARKLGTKVIDEAMLVSMFDAGAADLI